MRRSKSDGEEPGTLPVHWLRRVIIAMVATAMVTGGLTFGFALLLVDVFGKQQEARNPFYRVVELSDDTEDPTVWAYDFPMQYDLYKGHGGHEAHSLWGKRGRAAHAQPGRSSFDRCPFAAGGRS